MANQSSTPFDQGLFLVHLNRGREHFDSRNFAEAAGELEEARRLRPNDDSVLNLLGLAYFKQEKFREADTVYRKLIELNPESSTLHFNLGLVCFKLGDLDRAEATFLRTLELKPENQKTHFYLGNIYEKKKQYYNAIFQYRKAGANIMVKRVQEKIDSERPSEDAEKEDFTLPSAAPPTAGDASPSASMAGSGDEAVSNPDLKKINVDHIDRTRILTALQEGLFTKTPSTEGEATGQEAVPSDPSALADTQEEIEPPGEAWEPDETVKPEPKTEDTIPPPSRQASVGNATTKLRLSEPILQDQSLAEIARSKVPSDASAELFTAGARDERREGPPVPVPPAETVSVGDRDSQGIPQHFSWSSGSKTEPGLYARMRRRDDIFRYLENNLMEVNFSGKVFIKQGTIYSYSGNLTFWVKPQREESVPPLVIVSGTGKLLLTDRQRDITVMQIEDEEIFVEPGHLLACQESLTPRYAVIEHEDTGKPGFHVLMIQGTGMLALSVASKPILLPVQKEFPVNVSSASLITWSGELEPTIVEDPALVELMQPGRVAGINLRLEGEGRVMMEKSPP